MAENPHWDDLEEYEEWDPSKGSFLIHAFAGSFAGAAEHSVMYPFDTIKTYAQAEGAKNQRHISQVVRREGVLRLWRGVSTMLTASVPAHAAYFSLYEVSKERFGGNVDTHAPLAAAASGAVATLAHDAIMTPMDVVKQRLQLGFHAGVLDCIRGVVRAEGLSALFISYPTTLVMNVPYAAITVAANESLKKILNPSNEYNIAAFLLAGAGAGALAAACTNPLDVVKTRLQTQAIFASSVGSNSNPGACASGEARLSKGVLFENLSKIFKNQGGNKFRLRVGLGLRYHYSLSLHRVKYPGNGMGPSVGIDGANRNRKVGSSGLGKPRGFVDGGMHRYNGLTDAARKIYAQEGAKGFMRGLKPRLIVHTPSVAISWTAYESAKAFLISNS